MSTAKSVRHKHVGLTEPSSVRPDETPVDPQLATWNDRMFLKHGTSYERGLIRRIQNARVAAVMRLAGVTSMDSVLELGCEAGRLLSQVPRCRRLVGADISRRALTDAEALFREGGRAVELQQVDAQRPLPFTRGEFSVMICSEMLEHVREPRTVLENIHAVAGIDTRVVVTVPLEAPKVAIKRLLARAGVLELLFPGVEPGQSEWHLQSFSRRMLLELADGLFVLQRGDVIWGCHYAARFVKC